MFRGVMPGLVIEDKHASIAVHVRAVAPELRGCGDLHEADRCAEPWLAAGKLRRLTGSHVVEYPAEHRRAQRRGHAVDYQGRRNGAAPSRHGLVFLGDDVTDEDAFRVITGGIGVSGRHRATTRGHASRSRIPAKSSALLDWLLVTGAIRRPRYDTGTRDCSRRLAICFEHTHLVVVGNREPYIHVRRVARAALVARLLGAKPAEEMTWIRPASGVVTALDPVMRACGGTWVAHGSGDADVEASDRQRPRPRAARPPVVHAAARVADARRRGRLLLRRLPTTRSGRSATSPTRGRSSTRATGKRTARSTGDSPRRCSTRSDRGRRWCSFRITISRCCLVSSRTRGPMSSCASSGTFPGRIRRRSACVPGRSRFLTGCSATTCCRFTSSSTATTSSKRSTGRSRRASTTSTSRSCEGDTRRPSSRLRSASIPTLWDTAAAARSARRRSAEVRDSLGYTRRAHRVRRRSTRLHQRHSRSHSRVRAVAGASSGMARAGRVRAGRRAEPRSAGALPDAQPRKWTRSWRTSTRRFRTDDWRPIVYVHEHREPAQIAAFYRAAAVCVVSSLHDGMNLVAKEFIASRSDHRGVLVLSRFTGAARELHEAVLVNPFADRRIRRRAAHLALSMPDGSAGTAHARARTPRPATTPSSTGPPASCARRAACWSTALVSQICGVSLLAGCRMRSSPSNGISTQSGRLFSS